MIMEKYKRLDEMRLKEMTTVYDVDAYIALLEEFHKTGDDEICHSIEKELWHKVISKIAEGDLSSVKMQELASAALRTENYDFSRWYA
jgi:hypothetical protein